MDSFLEFLVHTKQWLSPEQAAAVPRNLSGAALDRHLIERGLLLPGHVRRSRLDEAAMLTFDVGPSQDESGAESPARAPIVRGSNVPLERPVASPVSGAKKVVAGVAIERVCARRARSVTYFGRLTANGKAALLREGALVEVHEALLAAWLTTPLPESCSSADRVANYFDKGRSDSGLWISREFVDGRPLAEVIAAGAIPQDQVERLSVDILVGLAALHQRGSIHGRLHAGNVILSARSGRPRLVDHSLGDFVRLVESRDVAEDAVAPEVRGGADPLSRSDMWRFGVLLCEMLAGMVVTEGGTAGGRVDVAVVIAEGLRKLEEGAFRELVSACVQEDPSLRPFNGRAALQRVRVAGARATRSTDGLEGESLAAAEPEPEPASGRRRLWWSLAAAVLLLAGLGIVWSGYFWSPKPVLPVDTPDSVSVSHPDAIEEGTLVQLVLAKDEKRRPDKCGQLDCEKCRTLQKAYDRVLAARNLRGRLKDAQTADAVLVVAKEHKDWLGDPLAWNALTVQDDGLRRQVVGLWLAGGDKQVAIKKQLDGLSKVVKLDPQLESSALEAMAKKVKAWEDGEAVPLSAGNPIEGLLPAETVAKLNAWRKSENECKVAYERLLIAKRLLDAPVSPKSIGQAIASLAAMPEGSANSWHERKCNEGFKQTKDELAEAIDSALDQAVKDRAGPWNDQVLVSPLDLKAPPPPPLSDFHEILGLVESRSESARQEAWKTTLAEAKKRADAWHAVRIAETTQNTFRNGIADALKPYVDEGVAEISRNRAAKVDLPALPETLELANATAVFPQDVERLGKDLEGLKRLLPIVSALRLLGDFGQPLSDDRKWILECASRLRNGGPCDWSRIAAWPVLVESNGGWAFKRIRDASRGSVVGNNPGPEMCFLSRGGNFFYVDRNASRRKVGSIKDSCPDPDLIAPECMIVNIKQKDNGLSEGAEDEVFQPDGKDEKDLALVRVAAWRLGDSRPRYLEKDVILAGEFYYRLHRKVTPP